MSVAPELLHSNDKFHQIIHVPSPRLNSSVLLRPYTVTGTPVLILYLLLKFLFHFSDFQLAVF